MKSLGLVATAQRKPVIMEPVSSFGLSRCRDCGKPTEPEHLFDDGLCDLCTAEREDYLEDDYRNRYPEYYE
jgi:hypothetical protein